jgi:hypothetical protein
LATLQFGVGIDHTQEVEHAHVLFSSLCNDSLRL